MKESTREEVNFVLLFTFFLAGIILMIIGFFINQDDGLIFSVGVGLFVVSLTIGLFEVLRGYKRD